MSLSCTSNKLHTALIGWLANNAFTKPTKWLLFHFIKLNNWALFFYETYCIAYSASCMCLFVMLYWFVSAILSSTTTAATCWFLTIVCSTFLARQIEGYAGRITIVVCVLYNLHSTKKRPNKWLWNVASHDLKIEKSLYEGYCCILW